MSIDPFEFADFAVDVARKAGKQIMAKLPLGIWRRSPIEHKGERELVSEVDVAAEQMLCKAIVGRYPDHSIVAEESGAASGANGEAEYRWIIDPLDGTTNFLHGHPLFAVSVALEQLHERDAGAAADHAQTTGGEGSESSAADEDLPALSPRSAEPAPDLVAGVVFLPYLDETFFAVRGGGAYLNSRTIRLSVSATAELDDAVVASGFAYDRERFPNYDNFVRVARRARGIRRCGSAAIDLAFVAAGRYDAYWELGLRAHDVAAGALLVREAGGRVEDMAGGTDWLEGRSVIATNGHVHDAVRDLLDPIDRD